MTKNHHRNGLEIEAGCRLAEIGGMAAGVGDGYQHVKYWMEDCGADVPPCRDGVAQDGSLDRLGRPLQRGRGLGLFDDIWPRTVVAGFVVEMIPVNFKGSRTDPYGNRDLTSGKWDLDNNCPMLKTPLAAFFAAVDAGTPVWVCLLTEQNGSLMMRRADASRVWAECQSLTTPKGKPVCHLRATGSGAYKGLYRRVRIEWRHVPANMWFDADWTPFDANSALPLPYMG